MGQNATATMTDRDFVRVIWSERQRLLTLARRLAPVGIEPEDLVQDALTQAWQARRGFRGEAHPRTWLQSILMNRLRNLLRVHGREVATADTMALPPDRAWLSVTVTDPQTIISAAEDEQQLRNALHTLAPTDRSAIVLRDAEGWSIQDIAAIFAISTEAAHKRIQRARLRLADALREATGQPASLAPESCTRARELCLGYLDGDLGEGQKAEVEEHLNRCEYCPPLVQALMGLRQALWARHDARLSRLRDSLAVVLAFEFVRRTARRYRRR
ncbi:sigma-70 family RNA polymerase sigma factor [Amycolatopsis alkalitolerans]|uniref:Sigma-70 family RNA polymerase sigma factor n=1 Tax=Amycolatopsis alkalitolerans TaxID=2547244 RepID=A0A5C4LT61_9PSEU|nr:sigma-70 family RNA polymerase sigma factor [Amycolatopsis alkalitolerans]TNC20911.1 sigma-70 family RNA polymerase sigma factor [Amycolatopsis alkalitolerans]